MKAKDLIKVLQALDPEKGVSFSLGRDQEYRDKCAKAELICGDCLGFLAIDKIEFHDEGDDMWCDIVLKQDNLCYLDDEADKFDEKYKIPSKEKYQIGDIVSHRNNTDLRFIVQAIYKDGTYRIVPLNADMGEAISSATEECMTLIEKRPV